MKKVLFVLQIVLMFCGLYSCSEKEEAPQLDVKPNEVELDTNNSGSFSIVSNSKWAIAIKSDEKEGTWLTVSQENGMGTTDIVVRAKGSNTGLNVRSQVLTITAENLVRTVTVKQNALPKLEVDSASISFKAEGGENSFGIISNQKWTVQSNQDWCVVKQLSGEGSAKIIVNADAHESLDSREAEITVVSGSLNFVVKVIQAGATPFINVEEEHVSFDAKAGSKKVLVKSNTSWSAKSSDTSWCTVSSANSDDEESVTISVKDNLTIAERRATVTLEGDNVLTEIDVVQSEGDGVLTVSKTECSFSRMAESATFSITSNMKWTISSSQEWCMVDKTSGEGNASSVKISVTKNTVEQERTAIVTVKGEKDGIKREIKVTQAKRATLNLDVESITIESGGGSYSCNVTSDANWTATSNATWCTVSPTSSSNSKTLTIKATENNSLSERSAKITVSADDITKTITVTQKPGSPFLTISSTYLSFYSQSNNKSVTISSNIGWTATSDQSWCTLSPSSGNGNSTLYVYVSANNLSSDRTATITVTGNRDNIVRTITVYQEKESVLNVSASSISMNKGGGSQTVSVTSNTSWTVSSNQSWCTVSKSSGSGNGSFTINASSNSTIYNRTATVTITGGGITRTISVTQEENITLTLSRYSDQNSYIGDEFIFKIDCDPNLSWYIKRSDKYYTDRVVSFSPKSGTGPKWIEGWTGYGSYKGDVTYLNVYTNDGKLRATFTITYY